MNQTSLEQLVELIKKTGDKLVVLDKKNSSAFVVLSLRDYERLALNKDGVKDLTEDELLNKINRDIAIWKSEQKIEESEGRRELDNNSFFARNKEKSYDKEDFGDFEKTDIYDKYDMNQVLKEDTEKISKNHWNIPKERKAAAEEVIIEEDRQYLEDIK